MANIWWWWIVAETCWNWSNPPSSYWSHHIAALYAQGWFDFSVQLRFRLFYICVSSPKMLFLFVKRNTIVLYLDYIVYCLQLSVNIQNTCSVVSNRCRLDVLWLLSALQGNSRHWRTTVCIKSPGPRFTKRTDVLPPNLVKSRSREIAC